MTKRPPLEFDVSVKATKRRPTRTRGMSGAFESSQRGCEWPGCTERAAYRAPKSRDHLSEYRWFCLEHVRQYNSQWNYYADMTDEEVQESMRADQLWGRQTWRMGEDKGNPSEHSHEDGMAWKRFGFEDPLEVLGEKGTLNSGEQERLRVAREKVLPKAVRRALSIMELDAGATKQEVRTRYKEMVTRFHPDQNGGDRTEESRLRDVLWAWDQLKNHPAFSG